jgi:hypothetical protein
MVDQILTDNEIAVFLTLRGWKCIPAGSLSWYNIEMGQEDDYWHGPFLLEQAYNLEMTGLYAYGF